MNIHFKIIVPSYNSAKWLRKTLTSIATQSYKNYEVCIIDDASTQQGQKEIIKEFEKKYNWKAIYRNVNRGALLNIIEGIKLLKPAEEDVIVLLDGDDWLYGKRALTKVAHAYEEVSVNMTYGQFITYPRWQLGLCAPLSKELLEKKNFREAPFIFSHLRTFKYKLWNKIQEKDLKNEQVLV